MQLLREYKDVLGSGNYDVGLTKAFHHEIPRTVGTIPIQQPTHRFGPEKRWANKFAIFWIV